MSIDSLQSRPLASASTEVRSRPARVSLAYLGAMAASFLVAYAPTYVKLANGPWQTEQEGHGPLIMLAAGWLAWQQRDRLSSIPFRPNPVAGWIVLAGSLLLMALS